jgi:hypothetical protein
MNLKKNTPRIAQHWTRKEEEKNFSRIPQPRAGTAGGDTTALPVEAPRHGRPTHPGTTGLDTPALPLESPETVATTHGWHYHWKHPGTASPTHVDFI